MSKKTVWDQEALGNVAERRTSAVVSDVAVKPKVSPRASQAGKTGIIKDSITLQKENSCLVMLLAGHYGTETGDNTADVVWGKEEFIVSVNLKK